MKHLFQVRDLTTGNVFPEGHTSREAAKVQRDALQGPREPDDVRRYVITLGFDHPNYRGPHVESE